MQKAEEVVLRNLRNYILFFFLRKEGVDCIDTEASDDEEELEEEEEEEEGGMMKEVSMVVDVVVDAGIDYLDSFCICYHGDLNIIIEWKYI